MIDTEMKIWRLLQVILYLVGILLLVLLFNDSLRFFPSLVDNFGRDAFWNILIFSAPFLFAVIPGVWRNICPLGTTSLLTRYLGLGKKIKQSKKQDELFYLISILLLYLIVPLRHVETSGFSVASGLVLIAIVAFIMGYFFQGKSGWCSRLCPVYPVERLYGSKPLITVTNAHCSSCANCTSPCSDSTVSDIHAAHHESRLSQFSNFILIGGFPGFVWGWFQVSDFSNRTEGWSHLGEVYAMPLSGLLISIAVYWQLRQSFAKKDYSKISLVFAATAISCYYFYRIPAVLGFSGHTGVFGLDLSVYEHYQFMLQFVVTLFFFWWIVFRKKMISWEKRPKYKNC